METIVLDHESIAEIFASDQTELQEEQTTPQLEQNPSDDELVLTNDEEEETEEEETEETPQQSSGTAENKPKAPSKPNPYQQAILAEMTKRATEGDLLLATALKSPDKSIKECYEYVLMQARKKAVNNCAMVEDAVVYGWAHHYYIESKATIDKELHPQPKTKPATPTAEQGKKTFSNPLLAGLQTATDKPQTATAKPADTQTQTIIRKGMTTTITTDKNGNRTTIVQRNGQTYTMQEPSLFS